MKRMLMLVAASVAISTAAPAQDTRSDAAACTDSVVTGLYRRCALWLEGGRIRRGEDGAVVARPGFFRPMAMTRVVAGDSALAYARTFERQSRQSTGLLLVGGLLMASAYAIVESRSDCNLFGDCTSGNDDAWLPVGLALSGLAISIPGWVLEVKARRAGAKAIWWNNERFAR